MASPASNPMGNNGGRSYDFLVRPVRIDCKFQVNAGVGTGIVAGSIQGAGIADVFMHTSTTPSVGPSGYLNPNPDSGYALIRLANNYAKFANSVVQMRPPLSGSDLAINATALTAGVPYVITAVGIGTKGAVTIAPVADTAGSLASKYFVIYDSYGNKYVVWFSVSGVGSAPVGVGGTLVQQSITTGDSAATIGAALAVTLAALPAAQPGNISAPAGVFSFTAAGTTTVTVTNTADTPFPGGPADGVTPLTTGFTFAVTKDQTNLQNWQAIGLPRGINPAIGVSFIATATGYSTRGGSTGTVQLALVSGISATEVIGSASLSLNPIPMGGSSNVGGWIMIKFLAPSVTSVLTGAALGTHTHNLKIIGGQAAAGTDAVSAKTLTLGKEAATDITIIGANSATLGGVVAASAGTPDGTIVSTTTMVATAPASLSWVHATFYVEQSSEVIRGL